MHDLLDREPMLSRLRDRWGDEAVRGDRADRTVIGARVFNDPDELAWLEQQVHPLVRDELAGWMASIEPGTRFAVAEIPLLFEGEMSGHFDRTVAIVAGEEIRRRRARARGHVGLEGRESRQLTQDEKAARADIVIPNDGSPEELESRLGELLDRLGAELPTDGPG